MTGGITSGSGRRPRARPAICPRSRPAAAGPAVSERFFGFGQQITYFDQKGRRLPHPGSGARRRGAGHADHHAAGLSSARAAIRGVMVGDRGIGAALHNYSVTTIVSGNDGIPRDRPEPSVASGNRDLRRRRERPGAARKERARSDRHIQHYRGRMRELPDWVHAAAIIRVEGGTEVTGHFIYQLADAKVSVAALRIQDRTGQNPTSARIQVWWSWQMNTRLYSDWPALRQAIADRLGARVLLYVNPFLTTRQGHDDLCRHAKNSWISGQGSFRRPRSSVILPY